MADVIALGKARCIVGLVCRFCRPLLQPPHWFVVTIVSDEGSMRRHAEDEVWGRLARRIR